MSEYKFLDLLPKKNVPYLQDLLLKTVASAAKRFAEYSIPKLHEKFCENKALCESVVKNIMTSSRNNLISRLPYKLYDQVISKILRELTLEKDVYNNEFRQLFSKQLWILKIHTEQTSLVIESGEELMRVMDITSSKFECLTKLDMSGTFFTDSTFSLISDHCAGIKHLKLSNLTNASISFFTKFQSLEKLTLRSANNDELIAELLMENTTLKQLKVKQRFAYMMDILKIIESKGYNKSLNIEEGLFTISCQSDLRLITAMCPKLKKVSLFMFNGGYTSDDNKDTAFYPNLVILTDLTDLVDVYFFREIKVYTYNFDMFLIHGGKNITKFYFQNLTFKSKEMMLLGILCCNLKHLYIETCLFANDDEALQVYQDQIQKPMFENLETLDVTNGTFSIAIFKIMLTKTYNIKHVCVDVKDEPITDEDLQIILSKNPMTKLESFKYQCKDVSLETIATFVRNSKNLKTITIWDIDDNSLASGIQKYIEKNNIDFDYKHL